MYQSKNGNKYGSAYVGKRHDEAFKSYDAGEQPGEYNENEHATPQEAGSSEADVAKVSPTVHTHYAHDHDGGKHSVIATREDGSVSSSDHGSAADAYGHGKALAFEAGGEEQATSPKKREHYPEQGAESEDRNYEMPDLA